MDDSDISNIKVLGPWVLLAPEKPKNVSKGGIYLPDGNLLERLGHLVGVVVSVSEGYWEKPKGKTKKVFIKTEIKPGDRVVFRGHLQDANRLGKDHCFLHIKDLVGILDEDTELEPSLPH